MRFPALLLAFVFLGAALAGCAAPAATQPTPTSTPNVGGVADFGDAPEGAATGYPLPFAQQGSFPVSAAADGARVLDVDRARLGAGATTESAPNAPDADDGLVDMVLVLTQLPPPAVLTVRASAPAASQGGVFHLNVLIDRNLDGAWSASEWAVQNQEVTLAAGESKSVPTAPFALTDTLLLPDTAWMRVALTSEPAPADWTGTGEFAAGEVEDHVVKLPLVDGKRPAIAHMTCAPARTVWPDDAPTVDVQCTVANAAPVGHGTAIRWDMVRTSGGVDVAPAGGNLNVLPGASETFTVTASRGELPSVWRYKAVGIDPPSRVTAEGIDVGHGESVGEVAFEPDDAEAPPVTEGMETAKACAVLIAEIETSREHRAGESDAIFWVYVKAYFDDAFRAAEGARVVGTVDAPGNPQVEAVADEDGLATIRQTVYSYGDYTLEVEDLQLEGCEWDREGSQTEATAAVQPD